MQPDLEENQVLTFNWIQQTSLAVGLVLGIIREAIYRG
jgi:hypothetical protein